jgi:hypothetical protein
MKNRAWLVAWGVAICVVLSSVVVDARKLLWADEIYTVLTARKAHASDILQYIREGCEGIPPLYLWLVHFLIPIVKNEALAARLPATLGFGAMMLGLFAFCKARMNATYALLAALLCYESCVYFATEGRPYGAVLGCVAWALVFWQRAKDGKIVDLVGLGACLGLAVAFHYYAICVLGPLLLAEIVSGLWHRKWNTGVLAAMLVPIVVLALHYPLIKEQQPLHIHFWSQAEFAYIRPVYERFLGPIAMFSGGIFAISLLLGLHSKEKGQALPIRETIMLVALCATPALTIVVSRYTTHAFVDRYVLWAATGFAIVAAAALQVFIGPNGFIPKLAVALLLLLLGAHQTVAITKTPRLLEGQFALELLEKPGAPNGPIVIPNSHVFVELAYYAPKDIRSRIVYPADVALDIRYFGADSSPLQYLALGKRHELAVQELPELLRRYSTFTMLAMPKDYLPNYLLRQGFKFQSLSDSIEPVVWRVER